MKKEPVKEKDAVEVWPTAPQEEEFIPWTGIQREWVEVPEPIEPEPPKQSRGPGFLEGYTIGCGFDEGKGSIYD